MAAAVLDADIFRLMVNQMPGLVWLSAGPGALRTYVNPAWLDFTGRTLAETVNDGWQRDVFPDDLPGYLRLLQGATDARQGFEAEYRLKRRDGMYRWLREQGAPLSDEAGQFVGYVASCQDITRHKRTEDALRESEQLARERLAEIEAIYDSAPVGLCYLDATMRFRRINKHLADINGLPVALHIGRLVSDVLPDIAPKIIEAFRQVVETKQPRRNVEIVGETPAQPGVERIWLENWMPYCDADGTVIGINVVAEEVTEQRRLEKAYAEGMRFVQQMISAVPDLIYVYDLDTEHINFASPQLERILGYSQGEVQNLAVERYLSLIHPDDLELVKFAALRRQQLADDTVQELTYRIRHASGEWRWIYRREMILSRHDDDSPWQVIGTAQDVSDKKHAEREREDLLKQLQAERAHLETILQQIPVGVIVADKESNRQTLGNAQVARILGQNVIPGTLIGFGPYEGVHSDGRPVLPNEWPLQRALTTGEVVLGEEIIVRRPDQSLVTLELNAAPVLDSDGEIIAAMVVFSDVTTRKRAETVEQEQRRFQQALLEMTMAVNSSLKLNDVLDRVLDNLAPIIPHDAGLVLLVENGAARVHRLRGFERMAGRLRETLDSLQMDVMGTPALRQMYETRQPLIVPNIYEYQDWGDNPKPDSPTIFGFAGAPMFVRGELIGFLDLYSHTPDFFKPVQGERLRLVAEVVATAIQNARLYQQAQTAAVLEERQRLARDLHDAISQTLFSARLIAEALPRLWAQHPDRALAQLEQLAALNRSAQSEMRVLLIELRPEQLLKTELRDQYGQLADVLRGRGKIKVDISISNEQPIPAAVQAALYRITQESFNNIIKHAQARQVALELTSREDSVTLHIRDDGRGFDPVRTTSGLGLTSMHERADQIGAALQLTSRLGQGTEIQVEWRRQ